ncbi:MAG: tetratricopeptide repeat protein [Promethearchaeota archaeon]
MRQIRILEELFRRSKFQEGISLIESFEKDPALSAGERTLIQIKKIKFLEKLSKYSEALNLADLLLNTKLVISDCPMHCQVLIERSKVLFSMGDMENLIKSIEVAEQELFLQNKEDDPEILEMMASLILIRGGYYWHNGELDNALYYFKFNMKLQNKLQLPLELAHAYNNLGVLYNALGDLNSSFEHLTIAYHMYDKLASTRGFSKAGNNIGAILIQWGQLDNALAYMEKSLEIDIEDDYCDGIRVASHNMGEVFWHKGEDRKAFVYLMQSLKYCTDTQDDFHISETLVPLIAVSLNLHLKIDVKAFLDQISQINYRSQNKIIHHRFLLAKSLVLIEKGQNSSLLQAEANLLRIVRDKVRYHDVSRMATNLLNSVQKKIWMTTEGKSISKIHEKILSDLSWHSFPTLKSEIPLELMK